MSMMCPKCRNHLLEFLQKMDEFGSDNGEFRCPGCGLLSYDEVITVLDETEDEQ